MTFDLSLSGYCGADIRAVCTEAALCALRRRYPQIYGTSQKLLLDVSSIAVSSCDFVAAMRKMSPAARRSVASPAKPLSPVVHPLLGGALRDILEALQRLFPHAEQGMKRKREPGGSGLKGGGAPPPFRSDVNKHLLLFSARQTSPLVSLTTASCTEETRAPAHPASPPPPPPSAGTSCTSPGESDQDLDTLFFSSFSFPTSLLHLLQECSQTPDVLPSQDAPGRSTRRRSDVSPGSCSPARFGAFHRPQPGLCRAVRSQQHLPGGGLRPGKRHTGAQHFKHLVKSFLKSFSAPSGVLRGQADVSQHPLHPPHPAVVGDCRARAEGLLSQPAGQHPLLLPHPAPRHLQRPPPTAGSRGERLT